MRNRISLLLIVPVLSLLSVSCIDDAENGSPYILFEVHGKVVDTAGNPIEGIQITSGVADPQVQVTNVNGNFSFFGRSIPTSGVSLTFTDKDGEDNGGDFQKMIRNIDVALKTPGDESGNFKGTYFAQGVEIVMIPKEDELDPDSGLIPLSSLQD